MLISDEPGCPNAAFAALRAQRPELHTTLVLHGTKVSLAKRILRRGFDPTRVRRMHGPNKNIRPLYIYMCVYMYIWWSRAAVPEVCHVGTFVLSETML